jgi:hypothetical protein
MRRRRGRENRVVDELSLPVADSDSGGRPRRGLRRRAAWAVASDTVTIGAGDSDPKARAIPGP